MSSIDPENYELTDEKVSYKDDFEDKLYFWRERLVKVVRRQGGLEQVAVADAVTGKVLDFPSVCELRRAKRRPFAPDTPFSKSPHKPAPSRASSNASATSSSFGTKETQRDVDRLQEKVFFLSAKIYSLRNNPTDLEKIEKSVDDLLKSLQPLSLVESCDSADDYY